MALPTHGTEFLVTALFAIVKYPEVPQATSPFPVALLYKVPIAEADGTKSIEDAASDNTTRMRNDFFIYPTLDNYHDK